MPCEYAILLHDRADTGSILAHYGTFEREDRDRLTWWEPMPLHQTGTGPLAIILQNLGTTFLSCLADAMRCLALTFIALLCRMWPKLKDHYTCFWLWTTLVVIGLLCTVYLKGLLYIYKMQKGYWYFFKIYIMQIIKKNIDSKKGKTRQEKTRRCGTQAIMFPLVLKKIYCKYLFGIIWASTDFSLMATHWNIIE